MTNSNNGRTDIDVPTEDGQPVEKKKVAVGSASSRRSFMVRTALAVISIAIAAIAYVLKIRRGDSMMMVEYGPPPTQMLAPEYGPPPDAALCEYGPQVPPDMPVAPNNMAAPAYGPIPPTVQDISGPAPEYGAPIGLPAPEVKQLEPRLLNEPPKKP